MSCCNSSKYVKGSATNKKSKNFGNGIHVNNRAIFFLNSEMSRKVVTKMGTVTKNPKVMAISSQLSNKPFQKKLIKLIHNPLI